MEVSLGVFWTDALAPEGYNETSTLSSSLRAAPRRGRCTNKALVRRVGSSGTALENVHFNHTSVLRVCGRFSGKEFALGGRSHASCSQTDTLWHGELNCFVHAPHSHSHRSARQERIEHAAKTSIEKRPRSWRRLSERPDRMSDGCR